MRRECFARVVVLVTSALHAVFDHRRRPASKIAEFRLRSGHTGNDVSVGRWFVDHYDGPKTIAVCFAQVEAELVCQLEALGDAAGRTAVYFWSADGEHDDLIWNNGSAPSSLKACWSLAEKQVSDKIRAVRAAEGGSGVEARVVAHLQASVEADLRPPTAGRLHELVAGGLLNYIAKREAHDVLLGLVRLPKTRTVLEQSFAITGAPPRAERRGGGTATTKKPFCGVVVLLSGSAGDGAAAVDLLMDRFRLLTPGGQKGGVRTSHCAAVTHVVVLSAPETPAKLKALNDSLAFKVTLKWLQDSLDQSKPLSIEGYLPADMLLQQAAARPWGTGGSGKQKRGTEGEGGDPRANKVARTGLGDRGTVPEAPGAWWCEEGMRWELPAGAGESHRDGIKRAPPRRLVAESDRDGLSTAWDQQLRHRAAAATGGKVSNAKTLAVRARTAKLARASMVTLP